jgi:hypothetical protein
MYLNNELKSYYLRAIEELDSDKYGKFERIDKGLKKHLDQLNSTNNLQSIFSKYQPAYDSFGANESYLEIAFKQEVQSELEIKIKEFSEKYEVSYTAEFKFHLNAPIHPNTVFVENSKAAWMNNNNYFNIYHFHLTFLSSDNVEHEAFWKFIVKELSML